MPWPDSCKFSVANAKQQVWSSSGLEEVAFSHVDKLQGSSGQGAADAHKIMGTAGRIMAKGCRIMGAMARSLQVFGDQ